MAATAATAATGRTRPRPTPRRGVAEAAAEDPVAAQGRTGREAVQPAKPSAARGVSFPGL